MLVNNFLIPLTLTIFIEVSAAFFMKHRDKRLLLVIAAVNAITNPFMNFTALMIVYLGLNEFFYWFILPMELFLIPAEWIILSYAMPCKKNGLLKLSAVMNICSFIVGLLVC